MYQFIFQLEEVCFNCATFDNKSEMSKNNLEKV